MTANVDSKERQELDFLRCRAQNALMQHLQRAYAMQLAASVQQSNLPDRYVIKVIKNKPASTPHPYLYRAAKSGQKMALVGRASPAAIALNAVNVARRAALRRSTNNARAILAALGPVYREQQMPVVPSRVGALLRELDRVGVLGKYVYVIGELALLTADSFSEVIDGERAAAARRNRTLQLLVIARDLEAPPSAEGMSIHQAGRVSMTQTVPVPSAAHCSTAYRQRELAIRDCITALCTQLNGLYKAAPGGAADVGQASTENFANWNYLSWRASHPHQHELFGNDAPGSPARVAPPMGQPAVRRLQCDVEILLYESWREQNDDIDIRGNVLTRCFLTTDNQLAPVVAINLPILPEA
ncbi:MAG TPA: hypothetical protein VJ654_11285 [Noviherbaspirillum sp.]|nr:hypothetical protein [Noviherbaspirillum sp.]